MFFIDLVTNRYLHSHEINIINRLWFVVHSKLTLLHTRTIDQSVHLKLESKLNLKDIGASGYE